MGEADLFLMMLPVTLEEMLDVIKFRAHEANDKYKDRWYKEHVVGFLLCLLGAAQFKRGTKLWSRKRVGLIPPLDFGQYMTEDRFKRVQRYLGRGPEGCDADLATDPWAQARWVVGGFNAVLLTYLGLVAGRIFLHHKKPAARMTHLVVLGLPCRPGAAGKVQ